MSDEIATREQLRVLEWLEETLRDNDHEDPDEASWDRTIGILMTSNEAAMLLALARRGLEKAT